MKLIPQKLRNKAKITSISATLGLGITFLNIISCSSSVPITPSVPSSASYAPVENKINAGTRSGDFGVTADSLDSFLNNPSKQKTQPSRSRYVGVSSAPIERPGLGTGWGKDISAKIDYTDFQRSSNKPSGVSSIYYNDKEGIKAMTNSWTYNGSGIQKAAGGLVEWGVKGSWGYLKNQHSRGKRFVTGNKNKNYSLVVKNLSHTRLEIVLSVDGLDVLDGKSASTKRRGYIVSPGETLNVKGFRKSADAVAAFKFSSVNSSYSQLSGNGSRNVGVIGMAVFTEKGRDPWRYGQKELKERNNARPFAEAPQLRAR